MLTTIELRWFYPGMLPELMKDWFDGDIGVNPESREDFYLKLPNCEYLGIKLRQGRLEVKLRQAELGKLNFGDNVAGKAEKWVKWMCEEPEAETLINQNQKAQPDWVRVQKIRWQRKYSGCNVELTQLSLRGDDWWSLAFEILEEEGMMQLEASANLLFQKSCPVKLQIQDFYAYPHWLSVAI
jgi:hypothetical protein